MLMYKECSHGEVELLSEEKGEKGSNRYYRCLKCGSVLVLSEEGVLYEVPKQEKGAQRNRNEKLINIKPKA